MSRDERSFGIVPFAKQEGEWRVFVVLHNKGHWAFPKGHPEQDESSFETAKREFSEETGLAVKTLLTQATYSERYQFQERGETINKSVSYFPAIVSGTFKWQEGEIVKGSWVSFDEATKLLTFVESRKFFAEVLDDLKTFFHDN